MYFVFPIIVLSVGVFQIYAQSDVGVESTDAGWIRVATDDGVFSAEIPSKYRMMHSTDWFYAYIIDAGRLRIGEMYILRSFEKGTLIGLEMYQSPSRLAGALRDGDQRREWEREPDIKGERYTIRQLRYSSNGIVAVKQYVATGGRVFVLTAASRYGETEEMKRFLASIRIFPTGSGTANDEMIRLSDMDVTRVQVSVGLSGQMDEPEDAKDKSADGSTRDRLALLSIHSAGTPDGASSTKGKVVLQLRLGSDGFVPEIIVTKSPHPGLTAQLIFVVLRMSFLPEVKDGKPEDVVRNFAFSYS